MEYIREICRNIGHGAGGGRMAIKRVGLTVETGAGLSVSRCPFCLTMFEDAIKDMTRQESLVAKDITEILVERWA